MGKFRDLMDEELRIRGYAPNTRQAYLRALRDFVRHFVSLRQACAGNGQGGPAASVRSGSVDQARFCAGPERPRTAEERRVPSGR